MKKNKQKGVLAAQKKAIKTELNLQINNALRLVLSNFSTGNKKIEKLISKNAKQLVKKLTKQQLTLPPTTSEKPVESTVKPTKAAPKKNSTEEISGKTGQGKS